MQRVLLVGMNEPLLRSRAAVLAKTGAEVVVSPPEEITSTGKRGQVDLLVMCHSIRAEHREAVAAAWRKHWPRLRILQLVRNESEAAFPGRHADAVAVSLDPGALLERSRRLLKAAG